MNIEVAAFTLSEKSSNIVFYHFNMSFLAWHMSKTVKHCADVLLSLLTYLPPTVPLMRFTVLPTKSDSDVIFCDQLLSETLTCTLHLS